MKSTTNVLELTGIRQSESSFPKVVVTFVNSNEQFHDFNIHPGGSSPAGIPIKIINAR